LTINIWPARSSTARAYNGDLEPNIHSSAEVGQGFGGQGARAPEGEMYKTAVYIHVHC